MLIPTDLAATYSNRGILHARTGNFAAALKDHNRAHTVWRRSWPASISIVPTRWSPMKRFQDALQDLDNAIAIADATALPVAHYNRALMFKTLGDTEAARADAERAAELAPETEAYRRFIQGLTQLSVSGNFFEELEDGVRCRVTAGVPAFDRAARPGPTRTCLAAIATVRRRCSAERGVTAGARVLAQVDKSPAGPGALSRNAEDRRDLRPVEYGIHGQSRPTTSWAMRSLPYLSSSPELGKASGPLRAAAR